MLLQTSGVSTGSKFSSGADAIYFNWILCGSLVEKKF